MNKQIKQPVQKKITVDGKEYIAQKMEPVDAFLAWEKYPLDEGGGELTMHMIEECIVHPHNPLDTIEHPFELISLGAELLELNYGVNSADIKKASELQEEQKGEE